MQNTQTATPKNTESKEQLINRLLKKATLDFKCCGGQGKCRTVTK